MGKCKCPPVGPNMSYLVSFGDCMTALLAFFIVLNSLAEEQTGANLHAGTGSFIKALESHGVPGLYESGRSQNAFQGVDSAPLYMVEDPEKRPPDPNGAGPDDTEERGRVTDRQKDDFHRFLQEIRRLNKLEGQPNIEGEVSFDILGKMPSEGSPLTPAMKETLNSIGPMLRQADYAIELTVWATTPSQTAWTRAVEQSDRLRQDAARYLRLTPEQQARFTAVGRTWIDGEIKRPAASVTLRKLEL
ncbi:MAG: hypothetical protein KDA91_01545 [Planctomycetaceae bacterium]|nr:hypothetical protein [Planctomycetaceae bacterium]